MKITAYLLPSIALALQLNQEEAIPDVIIDTTVVDQATTILESPTAEIATEDESTNGTVVDPPAYKNKDVDSSEAAEELSTEQVLLDNASCALDLNELESFTFFVDEPSD
jgi:hypothetical protein